MARLTHTHYQKGKWVWVRLKSGREIVDQFEERHGRFVTLKNTGRFQVKNIAAMGFRNHNAHQRPEN